MLSGPFPRETLIKCRQKAFTTGCTEVRGGPHQELNQNFPRAALSAPPR